MLAKFRKSSDAPIVPEAPLPSALLSRSRSVNSRNRLLGGLAGLGVAALAGVMHQAEKGHSESHPAPFGVTVAVPFPVALRAGEERLGYGLAGSNSASAQQGRTLVTVPASATDLSAAAARVDVVTSMQVPVLTPPFSHPIASNAVSGNTPVSFSGLPNAGSAAAPGLAPVSSIAALRPEAGSRSNLPPSMPLSAAVNDRPANGRSWRVDNSGTAVAMATSPQTTASPLSSLAALTRLQPTNNATINWLGPTNDWGIAFDWSGGVPGVGDIANFGATGNTAPTLVSASQSVSGLIFTSDAQAYTIGGGNSLTVGSAGIAQASSNMETIGVSSLVLGASQTWNVGSGALTVNAPISGNSALALTGSGTLTLTNFNTYTGLTTINAGTLSLNANNSSPSSPYGATLSTNSAGLLINGGGTVNIAQNFQIPQNLTVTLADSSSGNAATLNFSNASTQLNTLNLGNGALVTGTAGTYGGNTAALVLVDNTTSVGSIADNTTSVTSGAANATISAPVGIQGSVNLNVGTGSTLTISGNMSNWFSGGAVTKNGAGMLALNGAETYTGGTTINGGTLQLGDGATVNGSLVGNISDNASLIFAEPFAQTYSGVISGSGAVTKTGTGALTLTGASNFTGGLTVSGGTLALNAPGGNNTNNFGGALQSNISVTGSGSTLEIDATDQTSNTSTLFITNGGAMNIVNGHTSFSGVTLGGNATVSGTTADYQALYLIGNAPLTVTGSGNAINVPLWLDSSNTVTTSGAGASLAISGVISGHSLIKAGAGTLTLTGANAFTDGTTINAGTVVASGTALGTGAVSIASGGTLAVGQAANALVGTSLPGYKALSLNSLTLTGGSATPLLTFNLGATGSLDGSTNDLLQISGSANSLIFSSSSTQYVLGFASADGASIGGGQIWELMSFATPTSLATATVSDPNSELTSTGTGNLGSIHNGSYSWILSNGNIVGLGFTFTGADATPEPSSVLLTLAAFGPGLGIWALRRRRRKK